MEVLSLGKNKIVYDKIHLLEHLHLTVFGDISLDTTHTGELVQSKEGPFPVFRTLQTETQLGMSAHIARNIRELNSRVLLIGNLPPMYRDVKGVQTLSTGDEVSQKVRYRAEGRTVFRDDHDVIASTPQLIPRLSEYETMIGQTDGIVVNSYDKGLVNFISSRNFLRIARERNIPTTVRMRVTENAHGKDLAQVFGDYGQLILGADDATHLLGGKKQVDVRANLVEMKRYFRCLRLLVSTGTGLIGIDETNQINELTGVEMPLVDRTGVRDTVTAVAALSYAAGLFQTDQLPIIQAAAEVVLRKPGLATCSTAELVERLVFT